MGRFMVGCAAILFAVPTSSLAQTPLPVDDEVEWAALRDKTRMLLKGLDALKAPLPAETSRALKDLLEKGDDKPQEAVVAVQKILDAHCLIGVSINPESRVKAARGPASPELIAKRETIVLVKVNNQGGVTAALSVSGQQITAADQPAEGRWLKVIVANDDPFPRKLSGQRVDYLVLRLTPFEAGKREATFKFDVGQGTQDLGFRAEVPILFNVK